MSLKKLLENVGVLQETEEPIVKSTIPKSIQTQPQKKIIPNLGISPSNSSLKEKIKSSIMKILQSYKQDGTTDYMDLISSVEELKSSIPEERTRFISALTVAKTMNRSLTKESFISSVDYYLSALDTIRNDFIESNKEQVKNEVDSKQSEIDNLANQETQYAAQLEEIKNNLENIKSQRERLQIEKDSSSKKLEETLSCFEEVYNEKKNEILSHKEKITTYLN